MRRIIMIIASVVLLFGILIVIGMKNSEFEEIVPAEFNKNNEMNIKNVTLNELNENKEKENGNINYDLTDSKMNIEKIPNAKGEAKVIFLPNADGGNSVINL